MTGQSATEQPKLVWRMCITEQNVTLMFYEVQKSTPHFHYIDGKRSARNCYYDTSAEAIAGAKALIANKLQRNEMERKRLRAVNMMMAAGEIQHEPRLMASWATGKITAYL